MNEPCPNLGSSFQFPNSRRPHLRPNWLRSVRPSPASEIGFVFSNPPLHPTRPHPMGLFFQKPLSPSTPSMALGSFFQQALPHRNWLRSAKTSTLSNLGFVFSNPRLKAPLASNRKRSLLHPARPLGSFFQSTSSHPNWLRRVIRTHVPNLTSQTIAFSSLPLRKIAHPTHPVIYCPKPTLCYSISSTGCKLNGAPAFRVTPDRVRSKLFSVAHQARQSHPSFSSGPKRPSLVNLSHSQTQGSSRRQK